MSDKAPGASTSRFITFIARQFGWRGTWLIACGVTWIVFGAGLLLDPVDHVRSFVIVEYLPLWAQASGWWVTGLVALLVGLRGSETDDSAGHAALSLMPAVRVLSFLVSSAVYFGTKAAIALGADGVHQLGNRSSWYNALIWGFVSLMLWIAASWPNPTPAFPRPPSELVDRTDVQEDQ